MSSLPIAADAAPASLEVTGRVRVLLMTDTSLHATGGSERFLRNLLSRLPADRYKVTVVQLTSPPPQPLLGWQPDGVRFEIFPVGPVYGPRGWSALLKLWSLVRREQFDIVQSQHEKSDIFNALLPRRRGAVHISNRRDMGFNKTARLQHAFKLLSKRFDYMVAPAEPILAEVSRSEGFSPAKTRCIPNGVDTTLFRPLDEEGKRGVRASVGLPVDGLITGCVARVTEVKRHVDLLDAFVEVVRQQPRAHLALIGDGPLRAHIEARIQALDLNNHVTLLGDRPDVAGILPALDLLALASSTEGMSNALLEGMACGLPVVATHVGGNPQIVEDGVNGLLVPPLSPVELAAALLRLTGSEALRSRMGEAARARIERDYSLTSMAQEFDALYRELLGQP